MQNSLDIGQQMCIMDNVSRENLSLVAKVKRLEICEWGQILDIRCETSLGLANIMLQIKKDKIHGLIPGDLVDITITKRQ